MAAGTTWPTLVGDILCRKLYDNKLLACFILMPCQNNCLILTSKTKMCLFPVEMNTKLLSYSQSLGLVSVSSCDRYDMMLSSTFTLLILSRRLPPQLPQTRSVHFSHQIGPSKRHSWPQKWETTTIITAQDGNIVRNNLKIWKPLLNSLSPPPKLPFAPSSFFPCVNISPGFFFWSGPPLSASLPISSEGPSLFLHMHIHTQTCRAGMPSPSLLAVQLANPWTVGQLRAWTKLAS